ncbi:MAG: GNAT family N-acetyltransferase [Phycisphaerales bacterium]|nr:GNAT family N-acetyltransferase [Phycisphaerales bacterium]
MDMLVPLYRLPMAREEAVGGLELAHGIKVRHVYAFELSLLRDFVERHFRGGWADEVEMGFRHMPPSVLIAIKEGKIVGFAGYDCTFNGFFGPTGVEEAYRKKGIGKALLIASMWELKALGYAYAVVGSVSTSEFYAKSIGATPIEGSTPGAYLDMLKRPAV